MGQLASSPQLETRNHGLGANNVVVLFQSVPPCDVISTVVCTVHVPPITHLSETLDLYSVLYISDRPVGSFRGVVEHAQISVGCWRSADAGAKHMGFSIWMRSGSSCSQEGHQSRRLWGWIESSQLGMGRYEKFISRCWWPKKSRCTILSRY